MQAPGSKLAGIMELSKLQIGENFAIYVLSILKGFHQLAHSVLLCQGDEAGKAQSVCKSD